MDFLTEARKLTWRHRFCTSQDFREALKDLLLEKLAESGENTAGDEAWVEIQVKNLFGADE